MSAEAPKPKSFAYPPAPPGKVVDTMHGVSVPDPYRWLESSDDSGVLAWTVLEGDLARSLLDRPEREGVRKRLAELHDYGRAWGHVRRGAALFFFRHEGLAPQASYCVRADAKAEPKVLVDPSLLGDNGSVSIASASPSPDGRWVAYAIARAGSDYQELSIKDVRAGRDAPDRLGRLRQLELAWAKNGQGFYYANHPAGAEGGPGPRVLFHKLGDPQEKDKVVLEASDKAARVRPFVSDDGAWLVLVTAKGGESGPHEVQAVDLRKGGELKPFPLLGGQGGHAYRPVEVVDERLVLITGRDAPRGRLAAVDLRKAAAAKAGGDAPLEELVPQPAEGAVVRSAAVVGKRLFVETLERAKSALAVYDLKGKAEGKVTLPGAGAIEALGGRPSEPEAIVEYSSFTEPRAAYAYHVAKKELKPVFKPAPKFDASGYVVEYIAYPVSGGGRATMFLLHRKDVTPDGARLTYLVARGGPREALVPRYDPSLFLLLERGGVVAVPHLRGGFEAGEPWRSAAAPIDGRLPLDDLLAAARWLSSHKVTRASRLVVGGGAGGPLAAAALVETPELFGAAICPAPLADMLRYPKLGAGARLLGDYGDPADPAAFAWLHAYSPYHRAARGGDYPAVLVTAPGRDELGTAGHARKFVARLQATGRGDEPLLLRVGPPVGHGGEAPLAARLDEEADRWSFVFWRLGTPEEAPAGKGRGGAAASRPSPPSAAPARPSPPPAQPSPPPAQPSPSPAKPPARPEAPPARPEAPPSPPPVGAPIGGGWDAAPAPGTGGSPGSPNPPGSPKPRPGTSGTGGAPSLPPGAVEL
ncbi:MAG TPA: prolyl oligopeptidase family serine peptidase [Polyangiaceae bacterium]|nr:prolyl oligopeptidase family serine peptidase [Polyangiaceae bacterium]